MPFHVISVQTYNIDITSTSVSFSCLTITMNNYENFKVYKLVMFFVLDWRSLNCYNIEKNYIDKNDLYYVALNPYIAMKSLITL